MLDKFAKYYVRYECFLFGTRVEGAGGDLLFSVREEEAPKPGDYDDFELGGLTVQRTITEVIKIHSEA